MLVYGDAVDCRLITVNEPWIAEFLEGMRNLGGGFVFGCDEPQTLLKTIVFVMGQAVPGQRSPGALSMASVLITLWRRPSSDE